MSKQGYHFVGNDQFPTILVGFFLGPDDQKCFQRVLLMFVVWGPEKLFLGGLGKKLSFFCFYFAIIFFLITHNGEHIKNSKKNF
jgi:hypothetical protein